MPRHPETPGAGDDRGPRQPGNDAPGQRDGPGRPARRGPRRHQGRALPVLQPALPVRPRRHLGYRAGARGGRRTGRGGQEQGRRRAARADDQPDAHATRRARIRVLRRGSGTDRRHRGGVRPRPAVRWRRGDGQALRRQRFGDRALELRRAHRGERAARALPAPLRGLRARGRRHAGHGRLQHGQRGPDDRA